MSLRPIVTGEESSCDPIPDAATRASLEVALIDVGQRISVLATDETRWSSEVDHEDARFNKALQIETLRHVQAQRKIAERVQAQMEAGEIPLDHPGIVGKIIPGHGPNNTTDGGLNNGS
jgi:hypothetical protein